MNSASGCSRSHPGCLQEGPVLWYATFCGKKYWPIGGPGRCYQLFPAQNEQGFEIRSSHTELRGPVQIDGLDLIATKTAAWRNRGHESGVGRQGHKARKS